MMYCIIHCCVFYYRTNSFRVFIFSGEKHFSLLLIYLLITDFSTNNITGSDQQYNDLVNSGDKITVILFRTKVDCNPVAHTHTNPDLLTNLGLNKHRPGQERRAVSLCSADAEACG